MTAATGRTVVCGFCGREFLEDRAQPACGGCLLAGGCRWIRCPFCGYENPETPAWLARLSGRWARRRAPAGPAGAVPLAQLAEGERARVVQLDRLGDPGTAQLVALGIFPGAELTVLQRWPAFVLGVGYSEVALDGELAGRIWVARQAAARAD